MTDKEIDVKLTACDTMGLLRVVNRFARGLSLQKAKNMARANKPCLSIDTSIGSIGTSEKPDSLGLLGTKLTTPFFGDNDPETSSIFAFSPTSLGSQPQKFDLNISRANETVVGLADVNTELPPSPATGGRSTVPSPVPSLSLSL